MAGADGSAWRLLYTQTRDSGCGRRRGRTEKPERTGEKRRRRMLKLLRRRVANEAGFTLMELLVVVIIVGILAAVGVPLYLGYVRDSRLAEAKALAGSVLTAAQACAQQNTPNEAANCTRAQLAPKVGIDVGTGATGDGRWVVTVTPVTLNAATNQWGGGPIQIAGVAATNVANMAARVSLLAADGSPADGVVTLRCNTTANAVAAGDPIC